MKKIIFKKKVMFNNKGKRGKRKKFSSFSQKSDFCVIRYKVSNVELNTSCGIGRWAGENNHVEIDPCIYRYRGFNCRKKQFFFA